VGCGVWGLGFGVWGLGLGVGGLGFDSKLNASRDWVFQIWGFHFGV